MSRANLPGMLLAALLPLAAAAEEKERREPKVYVPTTFSLTVSGGAATAAERFVGVKEAAPGAFPDLSVGYHVFAAAGYRPTFGISEVWWRQRLAFELAFTHAAWGGQGDGSASYLGGMAGAKLDLLVKSVRPWIAQHAGFGVFTAHTGGAATATQGLAIRFAAGIDYAVSSFLRAGAHGAWQHTTGAIIGKPVGQDWYEAGLTVAAGF